MTAPRLFALAVAFTLGLLVGSARAAELVVLHVETTSFVVCPRALDSPQCPSEVLLPLDTQPTDPHNILPPVLTTSPGLVGGMYGVPLSHCRLDAAGYSIPTNPSYQVEGQPEAKSDAVVAGVLPVSNGKETVYMVRVATQPCQRATWQIDRVVVMEVVP